MSGVTTYTPEMADAICERLALGESLNSICKCDDMPALSTVYKWLREQPKFSENYARAKEDQADTLADAILDIADERGADPNDKRVRVDARKWIAAKLKPRTYGDKIDTHHTGGVTYVIHTGIDRGDAEG